MKEGGQPLLGGLDCMVHRNFFGAQINSFETRLPAPACFDEQPAADPAQPQQQQQAQQEGEVEDPGTFRAVFIRAPAITEVGPGGPPLLLPPHLLLLQSLCCAAWAMLALAVASLGVVVGAAAAGWCRDGFACPALHPPTPPQVSSHLSLTHPTPSLLSI